MQPYVDVTRLGDENQIKCFPPDAALTQMTALSKGHRIGPYEIVRLLGEGGMGAVYEAIQAPIGRRVALKVLLPEFAHNGDVANRFFNEARAVNVIEHPSLVQVSDFGRSSDGTAYLVMEFLRGESLESRLKRLLRDGRPMPASAALLIAVQMAAALAAAHSKGIVHRDLKPANVMLVLDPVAPGGERAKILDFGIAKLTQHQGKGTNTNALLGTPRYMSPEQCRGAGEVDDRTDVYALGVMLYEMLAGRTPFLGEGHGDFIGQHMFKEPPLLSEFAPTVPNYVGALVHRLLVKDRFNRPRMGDVETELSRALSIVSGILPASPADRDADATRQLGNVATPSILGQSQGQTNRAGTATATGGVRTAAILATIASLLAAGGYGARTLGRWMVRPMAAPSLPTPPAPVVLIPTAASQVADIHVPAVVVLPDLGVVNLRPVTAQRPATLADGKPAIRIEAALPNKPLASPMSPSLGVPARAQTGLSPVTAKAGTQSLGSSRSTASPLTAPTTPKPKTIDPYDL